ncbi:alpha/beta fold hydrolase [Mycolicibacterium sp. CH28]|uniref:alpha/beta fold hydrolase n=1 Tax=Mycolicibacterium sp. CH28 TaxID=2512237 RepID=UPI00191403E3|nr:alpha/beta hydrolase [Mycolicibacterium sp. CH28]
MPQSAITTTKVAVGEHEFHVNHSGERTNPAVVFLHGSGPGATALSNWEAVLGELGDEYYCVAPDVIGFGDSSHPDPAPLGLVEFTRLRVQTLVGLLDKLELEKATFVGNSMGGVWSLGIAQHAPQRVDKLVLMGAGGAPVPTGPALPGLSDFYANPSTDALTAMLEAFVYDPAAFGSRLRTIAEARMPQALRPEVQRSHTATFYGFDPTRPWALSEQDAAAIENEVLIIHGREDRFVPFAAGAWFFEHLPNARLYGIGHCGHWTQIEQQTRFVTATRAFLAGQL